ncbi:MAG: hypothetical protein NWR72_18525, partial [Bacteroidia bacterium]|nr:hypothetical protein [Bacteroidia bacterium]
PSFVYSKGGRVFHQVEWTTLWVSRDPTLANGNGQIVTAGETRGGTIGITYQPTIFLGKQGDPFRLSLGMFATQRLSVFSFTSTLPDRFPNSSAVIMTQFGVAVGGRFALRERFFLDTEILLTAAEFFAGRSEIEDPTITGENRVITFSNWNTGLSQVQLKIGVGMWL